jgi:hypothetical protein
MYRTVIGVSPPEYFHRHTRLFALLESLFPVDVRPRPPDSGRFGDANIVLGVERADALAAAQPDTPCLALLGLSESDSRPKHRDCVFGLLPEVPQALRGRTITELLSWHAAAEFSPTDRDTVLATRDGAPVWAVRNTGNGSSLVEISSVPLPQISDDEYMFEFFGRNESMPLLPLLAFVQRVTDSFGWKPASARACIVFDDANLSGPTYGCLDFARLAEHASRTGYHAAIAMIPLDTGRASPETVAIFRDHPRHLSVLVHGNNHQRYELARDRSTDNRISLLNQARRRSAAFSIRHGLAVAAVMEPPHGAIREEYFDPLTQCGFEAVFVTLRQYRRLNPARPGNAAFGMDAAEAHASGLAMIPRITADAHWRTDVLLASFLRHPIVVAGHHFDADRDLQWVGDIARFITAVGPHSWLAPSAIARSQFTYVQAGNTMHVRCYARTVEVPLSAATDAVIVERPWLAENATEPLQCSTGGGEIISAGLSGRVSSPVAAHPGSMLTITSPLPGGPEMNRENSPNTAYRLRVRRALTETRDRAYPRLPRILRRRSALMAQ